MRTRAPQGLFLTSAFAALVAVAGFAAGDAHAQSGATRAGELLREQGGSGAVFLVDAQGARRPIASPDVFNACGLEWSRIIDLAPAEFAAIDAGAALATAQACLAVRPSAPNPSLAGRLLRAQGGDHAVHLVDAQGVRRPIASPDMFNACGLDWGKIIDLPPAEFHAIRPGATLANAQACLAAKSASTKKGSR